MRYLVRMILVATLFYSGNFFADTEVKAAPYFKCSSGYSFDINNSESGAHCRKKVSPKVKPISCPNVKFMGKSMGTFPFSKSGKDICRGTVKIAGVTQTTDHDPLKCPTGYSYKKNHQGKKDRCVKPGGWIYKAPTVQFNSN